MSEVKIPRLFYYEEGENAFCAAPEECEVLFDIEAIDDGEELEIIFKRIDMTDEEFENLGED